MEAYECSFRTLTIAQAVAVFDEVYEREVGELLKVEPDPNKWLTGNAKVKGSVDIVRRRDTGAGQVAEYIAHCQASPLVIWEPAPDVPAVELPFNIMLGDVPIRGFIDQVLEAPDGRLLVRDVKTGTKLPSSGLQLGVYAEALDQLFGERPRYGDYFMCKTGGPTQPYDLTQYTTERLTRWFADMDRAETAGIYLPNVGEFCRVCTVQRWCDAMGSRRDDYRPGGQQDG